MKTEILINYYYYFTSFWTKSGKEHHRMFQGPITFPIFIAFKGRILIPKKINMNKPEIVINCTNSSFCTRTVISTTDLYYVSKISSFPDF